MVTSDSSFISLVLIVLTHVAAIYFQYENNWNRVITSDNTFIYCSGNSSSYLAGISFQHGINWERVTTGCHAEKIRAQITSSTYVNLAANK